MGAILEKKDGRRLAQDCRYEEELLARSVRKKRGTGPFFRNSSQSFEENIKIAGGRKKSPRGMKPDLDNSAWGKKRASR